jgi:cellulose synthase/poly-beta-1,6-N-acetylglucosamine synthase-like glycosyltransferase
MEAINSIHIMSGTCAIWRTSAFKSIEWNDSPVEDMDWTYQIHRKKLGKIAYAPNAIVYTQEPQTFKSYVAQMLRWYRGYWLTTARYKTPFGRQTLDISQSIFIFEFAANWARAIAFPLALLGLASSWLLWGFATDLALLTVFGIVAAIEIKDWDMLIYLPVAIFFYPVDMALNAYSLLTYKKLTTGVWESPARLRSLNV